MDDGNCAGVDVVAPWAGAQHDREQVFDFSRQPDAGVNFYGI
jgi:hypothetical protein